MRKNFKYRCTRRTPVAHAILPFDPPIGAGSGGDPGDGGHAFYSGEHYTIIAPCVELMAQSGQPRVQIMAINEDGGTSGSAFVEVHGDKGVRLTTGTTTNTNSMSLDGVEVITELNQPIEILRGENSTNPQTISIETDGFTIDANLANLMIQSMRSITLQVAGGTSSIKLTPAGITIQGPLIQIN